MKSESANAELKKSVGITAAGFVKDGMIIGIGTGSTVVYFIEELGRRVKQGLNIQGAATSYQSRMLCAENGIPLIDLMHLDHIDAAFDGADEIDPALNAIKGGGAAHTYEKIIASMADEFILIADQSKLVDRLCAKFPLPVEVIPGALSFAVRKISELGGDARIRKALRKDGPVVTENGNFILDISFHTIPHDLNELDVRLRRIPGLIETGLFLGIAKRALIGFDDGVREIRPKG